jgi:branched-chain amino acid transport system substrate-binding protein
MDLLWAPYLYSQETIKMLGKSVNGMVLAVAWHIDANRDSVFSKQSQKLWNADVSWSSAMAYDATQALSAAIGQQPNPTREGVQRALLDKNFSAMGASGLPFRFSPSGNRRDPPIQLVKIQDGKFKPMPPQ